MSLHYKSPRSLDSSRVERCKPLAGVVAPDVWRQASAPCRLYRAALTVLGRVLLGGVSGVTGCRSGFLA